ncbi:MAG: DUF2057 domain-containing protein [Neptuniibacter sp.]
MKTIITTLTSFLIFLSSSALAENKLQLGEGVNLIAVNGQEVNTEGLFNRQNLFPIPDGAVQLLVTYTAEIKKGSDTELETSQPNVLTFEVQQQTLSLSAPRIKSENDLEAFNKQKNWILTQAGNKAVAFKAAQLPVSGFLLAVDYEDALRKFNNSGNEAAIVPSVEHLTPTVRADANATEQEVIYRMLKQWYDLASPATQKRFLESVK